MCVLIRLCETRLELEGAMPTTMGSPIELNPARWVCHQNLSLDPGSAVPIPSIVLE